MIDWVLSVCLVDMFLSNHVVVAVIHCCITANYQLLVHVLFSRVTMQRIMGSLLLPMFCGLGACLLFTFASSAKTGAPVEKPFGTRTWGLKEQCFLGPRSPGEESLSGVRLSPRGSHFRG